MTVTKEQLRDIFETMGIPVVSEEEFNQQWQSIDKNSAGLIDYKDFKEFVLMTRNDIAGSTNSFVVVPSLDNENTQKLLAAETLSSLTNLFE